jgi:short-subunit dehydrogenase
VCRERFRPHHRGRRAYNAVYNASKAFLDVFSFALRAEIKDSGVSVMCLMPAATGNLGAA